MDSQQILVTDIDQVTSLADLKKEYVCKFILLKSPDGFALVFGSLKRFPYHANLVAQYCDTHAISSDWVKKPDLVEIYDPHVKILGGGYFRFGPNPKELTIFGASTAYGSCKKSDLDRVIFSTPIFKRYKVKIKS